MSLVLLTKWTTLLGTSLDNESNDISIGSDGSIYITGTTRGGLDGQTNSGLDDAFISKFNNDGEIYWTRLLGGSSYDYGNALTISSDGSIYIAGYTEGDLDGLTFNGGTADVFISKYDQNGTKKWTSLFGTSDTDRGYGVITGSEGSIYIAGDTGGDLEGQTNFGSNLDSFISKYNPDGTKDWTRLSGSSVYHEVSSVTTGSEGSI